MTPAAHLTSGQVPGAENRSRREGPQGLRHIKAVADLLGHSSIAITPDVCGHTSDDTARAAVDGLATRLGL